MFQGVSWGGYRSERPLYESRLVTKTYPEEATQELHLVKATARLRRHLRWLRDANDRAVGFAFQDSGEITVVMGGGLSKKESEQGPIIYGWHPRNLPQAGDHHRPPDVSLRAGQAIEPTEVGRVP